MIACLCEGNAEREIMDILMENGLLSFSMDDLLSNDFIRRLSGREFCTRYLGYRLGGMTVDIIHIQDSRTERFDIPKAYKKVIRSDKRCITSPEIEILIILAEGRYEDFRKSRKKPSEYCKSELGMRKVKSREFVRSYFLDADRLLKALRLYREYYGRTQDPSDIILYDLLNEGARRRADSL